MFLGKFGAIKIKSLLLVIEEIHNYDIMRASLNRLHQKIVNIEKYYYDTLFFLKRISTKIRQIISFVVE